MLIRSSSGPAGYAVVPLTVTSEPFVSAASTRDWTLYVVLNTAVDTANENASVTSTTPRVMSRAWRDTDAATIGDNALASGLNSHATTARPPARPCRKILVTNSATPIQSASGARNDSYDTDVAATPSGARTI